MRNNLLVAHGGGPTAVMNASLAGVIQAARDSKKIDRILAARHGVLGLIHDNLIDLTDLSDTQIEKLKYTPASAIGTCRYKVQQEDFDKILKTLDSHDVGYFFYNGGNDSMDTCHVIDGLTDDIQVIGIPKTIDNDLAITDHCPGFGSAARYYAVSMAELGLDIQALNLHVSIIEIMGRNTGWLTASTALARRLVKTEAPHLLYMPERPFTTNAFLSDVEKAWSKKEGIVIAASEGLVREDGEPLVKASHASATDGFGHVLRGNVSQYLAELVSSHLGIRARSEKPGLLARASFFMSSEIDRQEAYDTGMKAVRASVEGLTGFMAGLQRISSRPYSAEHILIPLADVANKEKKLPNEFINDQGNDIDESFFDYVSPLVGCEFPDYFEI